MKQTFAKKLSLPLLFLALLGGGLFCYQTAQGVNRTWDCGGGDNSWDNDANWSGDTEPGVSDVAIFDGTCTNNVTIDKNISVAGISIGAAYSGIITQSSTFTVTVGSSHYSQAAGTFTGGSGAITINGTYTLSGGTFTSTTGTLTSNYRGANATVFTVSGGTFSHNNGTVTFSGSNSFGGYTYTADVPTSLSLYNVIINVYADDYTFGNNYVSTASGDTVIATNDFTHTNGVISGTWEAQSNVTIGSAADGGAGTLTMTGTGSKTYTYTSGGIASFFRVNNAGLSVSANGGTTDLYTQGFALLAGSFTAPSGTLTDAYNATGGTFFSVASGTTFSHNNGTVAFAATVNGYGYTFTADVDTSLTLYNVSVSTGSNSNGGNATSTGSGDTIVVANNFTFSEGQLVGTWEVQGNYAIGSGADAGTAGIRFTGGNAQAYTDSGGDEPNGDVLVNKSSNTVTLASNADWNAASQDVTVTSGTLASSTYNITTVNFTVNGGTFTGGSGTVTTSGPMAVSSGTFTGGAGNINVNNTFTLSGGAFTSTSGTLTVGRETSSSEVILTVSGGTFSHGSGTVTFSPTNGCGNSGNPFTVSLSSTLTLYNVIANATATCGSSAPSLTASGGTVIAANDFTHTDGVLAGTWEVQGNVVIGSGADGGAGTLTMTGTGSKTYTYSNGGIGPHLRVNNAGLTVSANTGTTSLALYQFSSLAGTFTAPSGTMTLGYTAASLVTLLTVTSGTFSHNNGTMSFSLTNGCGNLSGTVTVDVNSSLTLYNVVANSAAICGSQDPTLTTASGDTIIVANNFTHTDGKLAGTWEVQSNYTVGSGADGGTAGITFTGGNNQIYTDQGGNEPDGDVTVNKTPGSSVRLASNADWNAASQDVTITSGELNMGPSYNISTTALTVSTDGHLSNNGTGDLTLAGNVSNAGNIRFMSSGTCGGSDSISIASSTGGVQRTWSGAGTYLFHDVTVQDQGGSATITAYSSTSVSNNGGNWTFSGGACPAQPPAAGISTGKMNLQSGKMNLR